MKNLYFLNEEEKDRILNLHESATKRQYLSEQSFNINDPLNLQNKQNQVVVQGESGDPYQYMKWGNKFWYAKKSEGKNPKWIEAKLQKAIDSINSKIYGGSVLSTKSLNSPTKKTPEKKDDKKQETNSNNFEKINVSRQVKKQLQYMKSNNILSDEKFTILDDKNSKVYEIEPGYKVVKSFFVLTGKNKGDELKTKTFQSWVVDNWKKALSTMYNSKDDAVKDVENAYFGQDEWKVKNTPSGIFKRASVIKNWLGDLITTNLAEETYGKRFITWETLDGNTIPFGFHGTQKPERLPVINNANLNQKISKRKMSFGCINFKESDIIKVNKFIDAGQISVWLPDATDDIVQFPSSFSKK